MAGMDMSGNGGAVKNKETGPGMAHIPGMRMGAGSPTPSAAPGMQMNNMQGMDMSSTKMGAKPPAKPPAAGPAVGRSAGYGDIPFPQPGPDTTAASAPSIAEKPPPLK